MKKIAASKNYKIAKRIQMELPFPGLDFQLPEEVLEGTGSPDERVLVRKIPFEAITMSKQQGDSILRHLRLGRPSRTKGLPELFWDTRLKQLIVEDGNHRIFGAYMDGDRTFDALVWSSSYNDLYRPVYDGEEKFDWGLFPNEDILESGRYLQ